VPGGAELLAGVVHPHTAAEVGAIIARLHAASAGNADIAQRFRTDAIFHAIRLEPYLLATAVRHPDLAPVLRALPRVPRGPALHSSMAT
jgi:hypothetical protein